MGPAGSWPTRFVSLGAYVTEQPAAAKRVEVFLHVREDLEFFRFTHAVRAIRVIAQVIHKPCERFDGGPPETTADDEEFASASSMK
jgi:hypothetical protein